MTGREETIPRRIFFQRGSCAAGVAALGAGGAARLALAAAAGPHTPGHNGESGVQDSTRPSHHMELQHKGVVMDEKVTAFKVPDSLRGAALFRDVVHYDSLGEHRAATPGDHRTADWLADELSKAGFKVDFREFSVKQFEPEQTFIEAGQKRLAMFPQWPVQVTPEAGVTAPVVYFHAGDPMPEMRGAIAVLRFPYLRAASITHPAYAGAIRKAVDAGAQGIVVVTEGPTGEIIAYNTPGHTQPHGVPLALLAPRDEPALRAWADQRRPARMVISGRYDLQAKARSVTATLDRGANDWLVVVTPQSGWFRCGGERGPGIALFLGLARWLAPRSNGSNIMFASGSGHELGGNGEGQFLYDVAPAPKDVRLWLHLGAGIATWDWRETENGLQRLPGPDPRRYLIATTEVKKSAAIHFAGQPGLENVMSLSELVEIFRKEQGTDNALSAERPESKPKSKGRGGSFPEVFRAGYTTLGLMAAHRYFHTPADRANLMTAPELLEPVGVGLAGVLQDFGF